MAEMNDFSQDQYRDPEHIPNDNAIRQEINRGVVDPKASQLATWIRQKQWGVDVREALGLFVEWVSSKTGTWPDLDQGNFVKNSDLTVPNVTNPYEPLSNNVAVNYIPEIDGYRWVQVIGNEDYTPFKGVRLNIEVTSEHPERFWIPADASFILRNDAGGDQLFHVDLIIQNKDNTQISKRVYDFIAAENVNTLVKTKIESPQMAGAKLENVDSCFYHIWADSPAKVKFRVTKFEAHLANAIKDNYPDALLSRHNLLGETDLKYGDSLPPYTSTTAAETLIVDRDVLGHNWASAYGTDETTAYKGVGATFVINNQQDYWLNKRFTGFARRQSEIPVVYILSVTYGTPNKSINITIADDVVLTNAISKLDYVIPSPKNCGLSEDEVVGGSVQLTTKKADNFSLALADAKLANIANDAGGVFDKNIAIYDPEENYTSDLWHANGLSKEIVYLNGSRMIYFASQGQSDYRNVSISYLVPEAAKRRNIKINLKVVNGDPASQQFSFLFAMTTRTSTISR
ncbi:hypothetical protein AAULR_24276 [Lacticaseibacillus rhamnosus MTCC 5462]|nr:hypothetical protein AAULR_24276 [Lacticaseibacillus rhamnosus MTCC 5462]